MDKSNAEVSVAFRDKSIEAVTEYIRKNSDGDHDISLEVFRMEYSIPEKQWHCTVYEIWPRYGNTYEVEYFLKNKTMHIMDFNSGVPAGRIIDDLEL